MNAGVPLETADDGADALVFAVARAQAGDTGAFAEIYRRCHRRVYGLCLRLVADRGIAEELTQDVFVRAWRALPAFRGDASVMTWLHRIAVNTVVSYQRRHGAWLDWLRRGDEVADTVENPVPGRAIDLEAAIARLPKRARQVFVLVDVEGYSHEETAAALGMAVGTSKAQLHRARALLRGMLT